MKRLGTGTWDRMVKLACGIGNYVEWKVTVKKNFREKKLEQILYEKFFNANLSLEFFPPVEIFF